MSAAPCDPRELLDAAQKSVRDMLEAEEALRLVRTQFEHTDDPEARAALAAEALDHVERQLELASERRQQLDRVEGKLWARRNRLEQFLIRTRGVTWWHTRRDPPRAETGGDGPRGRARVLA